MNNLDATYQEKGGRACILCQHSVGMLDTKHLYCIRKGKKPVIEDIVAPFGACENFLSLRAGFEHEGRVQDIIDLYPTS